MSDRPHVYQIEVGVCPDEYGFILLESYTLEDALFAFTSLTKRTRGSVPYISYVGIPRSVEGRIYGPLKDVTLNYFPSVYKPNEGPIREREK